jgi:selT/selW/selH-like putative selenoprotein
LTSKILSTFKQRVKDMKLVPGKGGCFELTADGDLIYSKLKTQEFPDEQSIINLLERKMK